MKRRWRWLLIPVFFVAALSAGLVFLARSAWLSDEARARAVEAIEQATGGKASIGALAIDWRNLSVSSRQVVLRGTEAADQAPLFRVESVTVVMAVSSWWSRDVRLKKLVLERPETHIYVGKDGKTNLPAPKRARKDANAIGDLIAMKIQKLEIKDGLFEFDSRVVPFSTTAHGLAARVSYEKAKPSYRIQLELDKLDLPQRLAPRIEADLLLEPRRLAVEKLHAALGESSVEASGEIRDFSAPSIEGQYKASVLMRDIPGNPFEQGFGVVTGKISYAPQPGLRLTGDVELDQAAVRSGGVTVRAIRVRSPFLLTRESLKLASIVGSSSFGNWEGSGELRRWRDFEMEGTASDISLEVLQGVMLDTPYPWNASAGGALSVKGQITRQGVRHAMLQTQMRVSPADGEIPVEGNIDLTWEQDSASLEFGSSSLVTPNSRVTFHGALGSTLQVGMFSTRLRDWDPVCALLFRTDDFALPVSLDGGEARLTATIKGDLRDPEVEGRASATGLQFVNNRYESAQASFRISSSVLDLRDFDIRRGKTELSGKLRVELDDWKLREDGPLAMHMNLRNADIASMGRMANQQLPVNGTLSGTIEAAGTPGMPFGRLELEGSEITWGSEVFHKTAVSVSLSPAGDVSGSLTVEKAKIDLAGRYAHPRSDFQNGDIQLSLRAGGLLLHDSETVQEVRPGVDAELTGEMKVAVALQGGSLRLRSLDGSISAPSVRLSNRTLGPLKISGATRGQELNMNLAWDLPGGKLEGTSRVQLSGDYPWEGRAKIPRVGLALIRDFFSRSNESASDTPWPVRGFLEGEAVWRGPLADFKTCTATVTINRLQVRPRDNQLLETQIDPGEFTLNNNGPVSFEIGSESARIISAKFSAKETDLELQGAYHYNARNPWGLSMSGSANLAVLGSFRKDLIASGTAKVDASLRGAAADPQLSGRMSIHDGAFFLKDLPTGIQNASGTVLFDRNRASIEKLTGQTGGGNFSLSGFIGFNRDELTYRLVANCSNVRLRYPEGVSNSLDADLTFTGSSARSLLAGTITVQRTSLNATSDLANMVGTTSNPIPAAATENEFLRNLRFDIKINTSSNAMFLSSYTKDLEAEANLRLRGTPSNPILLGSVKVSQGDVQFFGNRYTVSRGEILFYSTSSLQPSIDLDLETRVRGIVVYITVSGPMSKLNISYRSDPPLDANEILALLTVGRTPSTTGSATPTSQDIRSRSVMETTTNSLLGGALNAQLNSRTEKFFGASRIKIDPQSMGVDNLPQARLSIEQSISRDVTLTYITNLHSSQQQTFRFEWDLNSRWSMVGTSENGYIAVDFVYRKRLK
jgi:translocation and assembly module TamB